MLGKKQSISNDQWLETVRNIAKIVSEDELNIIVENTKEKIQVTTCNKKAAFAWSGGKDSIVLGDLCQGIGIHDCMIGICNLEYNIFLEWIMKNKPSKCEVINTGQDLKWLKQHPEMLFPQDNKIAASWFAIVQHRAQRRYYKNHNLDLLILGRRKIDGNYVGGSLGIYESQGVTRYSPLAEWKHEHILAYIHYKNLQLPPIYNWPNGYKCGTHPWPARQWTGNIENGWSEILDIEPSLIKAKKYLEG